VPWAAFLGISWTWCIGMFLPVLLVRDLGLWGWIVFAVPNVIGAAATGWVLKDAEQSRRMVQEHSAACAAFSLVTITFHVFFLLWFVPRLVGLPPAMVAFALVTIYLLATASRSQWDLWAAIGVWLFSLAMIFTFLHASRREPTTFQFPASSSSAAYLAPVCILGFLCCPYLDLTFHRTRQALTAGESKLAFGWGFGVCFFSMIVFTLLYSTHLFPLLTENWPQYLRPALGGVIAAHMIVQSAFTMAAHGRALASTSIRPIGILSLLVLAQIAIFLALASALLPRFHGLDPGEVVYRLFMSCYGLVFPAYVWLFMVRWRRAFRSPGTPGEGRVGVTPNDRVHRKPPPQPSPGVPGEEVQPAAINAPKLWTLVIAIAVAAPFYWLGFIENRFVWLLPGCAIIIASRFFLPRPLVGSAPRTGSSGMEQQPVRTADPTEGGS
jgi:hypothetical protein